MVSNSTTDTAPEPPSLSVTTSRQFVGWLAELRCGIAFSTYQAGKLFLLGLQPNGRLSVFERTFERAMGLAVRDRSLYLSTLHQIWRFHDALEPGQNFDGYDRVYIPKESRVTGDLDVHDIVVEDSGRPVFANTLFNCVATLADEHSFRKLWSPPWISAVVPEDRCHLNGIALRDGRFRYVTAVSRSDVSDGWRDRRADGGVVVDVDSGEVICEGLSMPHSPRYANGYVYLLDSGRGWLGRVPASGGDFERLCFVPGYARGLALMGEWAVVGLSDRRENRTFQGLELDQALAEKDAAARCGLQIVHLNSGAAPHWLRIEGVVRELYDVALIPDTVRPMAIGFKTDEIRRMVSFSE